MVRCIVLPFTDLDFYSSVLILIHCIKSHVVVNLFRGFLLMTMNDKFSPLNMLHATVAFSL